MTQPQRGSWRAVLPASAPDHRPLALGLQLRQREGVEAHWGPRRVRPATARSISTSSGELRLAARPLTRGADRGAWIQGDVSWESIRRGGGRTDPAVLRWFTTLYGLARDVRVFGGFGDSDWLTLDGVESDLLFLHLRSAATLGIPIVSTRPDQDVALAGSAEIDVSVDTDGGGLRATAHARVDGETAGNVRPVGHVGLYTIDRAGDRVRVRLAPVAVGPALHALLSAEGSLTVPREEVDEFLRLGVPRLRAETTVVAGAGVRLPAPERDALVLTATQRDRDVVEYAFAWHPAGGGAPVQPETFADDETGSAPAEGGRRAITRQIRATWSETTDLPLSGEGTFSDADAAEFVARVLPALEEVDGLRIELGGVSRSYRELSGDPRIRVTTVESEDADWFDLGILVDIEGRKIPFARLFTALSRGRRRILLSDGAYFSLTHPALDRLKELIEESRDLIEWEAGPRISRYHVEVWEDFEDLADEAEPAVRWRDAVRSAAAQTESATASPTDLPDGVATSLRPYQADGFRWLLALWERRLGGILADDMGLGKTLQVLTLLLHIRRRHASPALIVAPTSVVSAWREEAARHTPGLRVAVVDRVGGLPVEVDADVVVTSYALLRLDAEAYEAREWSIVVLDEAQALKNPRTRVHRTAQRLSAPARFALTGTPLENSLVDLWALLSLTSPGLFPSARRFRDEFVGPIERSSGADADRGGAGRERRLSLLRRRLRPFILRRTKDAVARDLPPRQEQDLFVALSAGHRAVYDRVLQRERRKVLGLLDDLDSHRFIVFRSLTLLRRLALAPSLVDAGGPGLESSKLEVLRERIRQLADEGHRALVFSQFTSYLDIVERDLRAHGLGVSRLDGRTVDRGRVAEDFRTGDDPVFLISLKAGGVGLTLIEADYVFLLDPWWNPAAERQAVDRTHRIGQTRPVTVYRLIAAGTIEEKVRELQHRKARLFDAVFEDDGSFSTALTADDIRELLS